MHAWEAIQKTLDYIEEHLGTELETSQLAEIAALSTFYYQKLFTRLVKKPVGEYIKLRRLANACEMLKSRDKRILDVALEYGFGSHETFTRAFKKAYGLTPDEFRRKPMFMNQFDKPDLLLSYIEIDEGVPLISEGIVLEFNRQNLTEPVWFAGISDYVPIAGQMPVGEATGPDLPGLVWERFHQMKAQLPRIEHGREIGVAYLGDAPEGSFTYMAGAEVAEPVDQPHVSNWQLPVREYIVCGFEAENFEQLVTVTINKALKYSGAWLERHDLEMELYSPEIYYEDTPQGAYMELWMPAVKKKG